MRIGLSAVILLGVAGTALAQRDLVGPFQYPEFRTLSGLPGGGFGVRPDGRPDILGAMAYSSPIAYSLRGGRSAFLASSVSDGFGIKFEASSGADANVRANGTAVGMLGLDLSRYGHLTIGYMVLSGLGDQAYNIQFTPTMDERRPQVAFGVQDLTGEGGSSGEGIPNDTHNSASPYVVVTAPFRNNIYASAGVGFGGRFKHGFASISGQPLARTRLALEHDGFNFNLMGAYSPDWKIGNSGDVVLHAGLVRMKYATIGLGFTFGTRRDEF